MISLFLYLTLSSAAPISVGCTPSEMLVLKNREVLNSIAPKTKYLYADCEPLPGDRIAVAFVVQTPMGVAPYLRVYERRGFSVRSQPIYQSRQLGIRLLTMNVGVREKLIYVTPQSTKDRVELWMNAQRGPHAARFAHWTLDLKKKNLRESPDRGWLIESWDKPTLTQTKVGWRAVISKLTVRL